jgi:hypothetical protein
MNEAKLKQLFEAARAESAPEIPFNFTASVLLGLRHPAPPTTRSVIDQLQLLFPRLAGVSLLIIGLSAASAFYFTEPDAGPTATFNQLTEQWFFGPDNS